MSGFTPNEGPQTRFLRSQVFEILYGGAAGGGKTEALIVLPGYQLALEDQRFQRGEIKQSRGWGIYFRRTVPRLIQTIDRAHPIYKNIDPGVRYNANDHLFTFRCGFKMQYGHMEHVQDRLNYSGPEFTIAEFDELGEFEEKQYTFIVDSRVRTSDPALQPLLKVRSGTNPVGVGVGWMKQRFKIDEIPPETIIRTHVTIPETQEVVTRERMFIPARAQDNPHLTKEYWAGLLQMDPALREALYHGNWNTIEGAFFEGVWDSAVHVVPDRPPSEGTFRFRCADFGYYPGKTVVCWIEVDHDDVWTVYHCLVLQRHTATMAADRIKEIEIQYGDWNEEQKRSMLYGPLDSACWSDDGRPSHAEDFIRKGVNWVKADKRPGSRVRMADQVRKRLNARIPTPQPDGTIVYRAGLRFMRRCKYLIDTLPMLPRAEDGSEDVDTRADDHGYDALGYGCLSRPMRPQKPQLENDPLIDMIAQARAEKRERDQRRSVTTGGFAKWR